ncbi:spore germination protein [Paenibacillus sp. S3N08]|uniref:Spore germination protein n=2 Tax=Paenibacillus agricola TaxID=2716264 RepID=A0ABX0JBE1_9BACL|nr:spore germination protein [Paenibacillus agricola]
MHDAEIIELPTITGEKLALIYLKTLIDLERLNEVIIEPLDCYPQETIHNCIAAAKISKLSTLAEAQQQIFQGSVVIHDCSSGLWWAVPLQSQVSRSIQPSETETILFGPLDSFTEQIDINITLIRRRLPIAALKSEAFTVGYLTQTTVVLMYIDGLTNPELVSVARSKLASINFDMFLDSSHVAAFMEDHNNSIFPQFLQTDRPDSCAYSLGLGKLVVLVNNTPFTLVAPVTLFHLFQSPEDYINRWLIASLLRCLRYIGFFISITLIPLYVALTTHHYQIIPLPILFVILESRSKMPFTPFWEAFLMVATLEIIKEASLRMPTKTSQTLGVIGGIVIGQAAVEAGFASKVLIVLIGISAVASFLVPNYLVTKSSLLLQLVFLVCSTLLGIPGIMLGMIAVLAHLNSLTSLNQPYLAPLAPFYWKDWVDLFIRGPLPTMKVRPEYLHPLNKWRTQKRRK